MDEEKPPKCRALNRDTNLQLIPSERLAAFVRAIRNKRRPWLQHLGGKMQRSAVRSVTCARHLVDAHGAEVNGRQVHQRIASNLVRLEGVNELFKSFLPQPSTHISCFPT